MDLFAESRYRINVNLLRFLGLWPFQSEIKKLSIRLSWLMLFVSQFIPQIHRTLTDFDEEVLITNITCNMTVAVGIIKYFSTLLTQSKLKQMSELMQDEWANLKPGPAYDIMLKHAEDGSKYTFIYTKILMDEFKLNDIEFKHMCYQILLDLLGSECQLLLLITFFGMIFILIYNSMIFYLLLPIRPAIMVWLGISEGPAEYAFPYYVDYWVDSDDYFFWIEAHICMGVTHVITSLLAPELFFLLCVQHVCGVFHAVCIRLENIPTISPLESSLDIDKEKDEAFWVISDCIKQHNRAINFSELLEEAYCWSFFFSVGVNTLIITVSGIQIVIHMTDLNEVVRLAPFFASQLAYIFVESVISQQLIDYSGKVDQAIKMTNWYAISLRSRKLLNLMTIRSRVIKKITAGKIFVMSLEFFSTVVRTSMTYFTLLRSVKEG